MKRNERIALLLAVSADAVQICLFPVTVEGSLSPVDDVIDLVAFAALTGLLGWHFAFLPTLLLESVPVVTEFPTWTAAVLFVTRSKTRN
jgi:hypothetical protein